MIAINVVVKMLLFFTISWMINHFGRNPVKGGRPPKDNIITKISSVIRGNLFHMWDREVVVVVEFIINSIKVAVVIGI